MVWDARRIGTAAALVATAGVVWLTAAEMDSPPERPRDLPTQRLPVGQEGRSDVSAPPELPGEQNAAAPSGLDFSEPDQVARAYLMAAYSLNGADRGRTNRRVLPYLSPDNPANPRGLVVVDAPAAGQSTMVRVDEVRLTEAAETGQAIAYQARWSVLSGGSLVESRTSFVVLVRQPDGRWLVSQETTSLQPGG